MAAKKKAAKPKVLNEKQVEAAQVDIVKAMIKGMRKGLLSVHIIEAFLGGMTALYPTKRIRLKVT